MLEADFQYNKAVLEFDLQYNKAKNRWEVLASRVGVLLFNLFARSACKLPKATVMPVNFVCLSTFNKSVHIWLIFFFRKFMSEIFNKIVYEAGFKLNRTEVTITSHEPT